ncbi:MAG: precorrin-2 dehydrogenase/sirohydrochlorin ferrochelatase family protein [Acidimicrobiales bacterium]
MDGPLYPVGLVVRGRRCLVVGGGRVAARKVQSLLACGASVTMVAPEVHEALGILAANGTIAAIEDAPLDVQVRPYEAGEAARYRLVVTATGDPAVDAAVFEDADGAGVWVNSADDPEHCTFVLPAVWRDGPVSVAVSSGATSPALAGWLRDRVAAGIPPDMGALAELLGEARRAVQEEGRSTESIDWRTLLEGELPRLVADGRLEEARALVTRALREHNGPVD